MITKYEDLTQEQIDRIIYMYRNRPCTITEISRSEDVTEELVEKLVYLDNKWGCM
jgi:hypothetical protein